MQVARAREQRQTDFGTFPVRGLRSRDCGDVESVALADLLESAWVSQDVAGQAPASVSDTSNGCGDRETLGPIASPAF